jgi:hypothetical protein
MPQTKLRQAAQGLDERIKVTHPSAWAALLAVLGVILAGAIVAFRVHLPETVTVPGSVYYAGGEIVVAARDAGVVEDITSVVGAQVDEGQRLLTITGEDGGVTTYEAPVPGALLELPVRIGQAVPRGQELVRLTRPAEGTTVAVVAFVSPDDAVHFEPGAAVDVIIGGSVLGATVTSRGDRRSTIDAMGEVLGGPSLALPLFQAAGGAPIALTVDIPNTGQFTDGTIATLRRVVADPTIWNVLTGGGR